MRGKPVEVGELYGFIHVTLIPCYEWSGGEGRKLSSCCITMLNGLVVEYWALICNVPDSILGLKTLRNINFVKIVKNGWDLFKLMRLWLIGNKK